MLRSVHMRQRRGDQAWVALLKSTAVQGVMWTEGVVDALPFQESPVEGDDLRLPVIQLAKTLGMGGLTSLDVALEFG